MSYHVHFIKSHQLDETNTDLPIPQLSTNNMSTSSANPSHSTTAPLPIHHSPHTPNPSEKQCAAKGIPYIPLGQQAHAYLANPPSTDQYQASSDEPMIYAAAWQTALQEEFASLKELRVYKLVPHSLVPTSCCIMKGHPIFQLKHDENGIPICFKARYICQGYSAVYGKDYTKTSSPTTHLESFHVLAHLGVSLDWEIEQIDIKMAYLHGTLECDETCYMEQPEGFVETGYEDHVWELQKVLYGTKQGRWVWNKTLHSQMLPWDFQHLNCEPCIYL